MPMQNRNAGWALAVPWRVQCSALFDEGSPRITPQHRQRLKIMQTPPRTALKKIDWRLNPLSALLRIQ